MNKEFAGLRKKIISHRRIKSAYVKGRAVEMVREDLKKNDQKENQYLLENIVLAQKNPQHDRTLLKKHNKKFMAMR